MKYKNIDSAIQNFGDSFLGPKNFIDGGYIVDELNDIVSGGNSIEIDWLNNTFSPQEQITSSIRQSIDQYRADLRNQLKSKKVDLDCIKVLKLIWPISGSKYMLAQDDRGKEYRIFVT